MCLAVGCPCECEGVLSASGLCSGAEFIQSPQKILGAARYSRRLGRAFWGVLGGPRCSALWRLVLEQQLNSDVQPWLSWEMLANHNEFDISFLEFGPPFPSNAALSSPLHHFRIQSLFLKSGFLSQLRTRFLSQAQPQQRHIHQH